jgi:glycosyltransferase involved in cell wall biosynthesis
MELLPEADGLLIGDGEMRQTVARMIEAKELRGRVYWQAKGNVSNAMAEAEVVVGPSRSEGLGIVALEAMALGRPVVASCVDGLLEVVEDGVSGFLVQPDNPAAIAEAIRRLISDRALREQMGQAGRERVKDCFTLSRMLANYEQLYQLALSKS